MLCLELKRVWRLFQSCLLHFKHFYLCKALDFDPSLCSTLVWKSSVCGCSCLTNWSDCRFVFPMWFLCWLGLRNPNIVILFSFVLAHSNSLLSPSLWRKEWKVAFICYYLAWEMNPRMKRKKKTLDTPLCGRRVYVGVATGEGTPGGEKGNLLYCSRAEEGIGKVCLLQLLLLYMFPVVYVYVTTCSQKCALFLWKGEATTKSWLRKWEENV